MQEVENATAKIATSVKCALRCGAVVGVCGGADGAGFVVSASNAKFNCN